MEHVEITKQFGDDGNFTDMHGEWIILSHCVDIQTIGERAEELRLVRNTPSIESGRCDKT